MRLICTTALVPLQMTPFHEHGWAGVSQLVLTIQPRSLTLVATNKSTSGARSLRSHPAYTVLQLTTQVLDQVLLPAGYTAATAVGRGPDS